MPLSLLPDPGSYAETTLSTSLAYPCLAGCLGLPAAQLLYRVTTGDFVFLTLC